MLCVWRPLSDDLPSWVKRILGRQHVQTLSSAAGARPVTGTLSAEARLAAQEYDPGVNCPSDWCYHGQFSLAAPTIASECQEARHGRCLSASVSKPA